MTHLNIIDAEEDSKPWPSLPQEIIFNILSRLPVKTLLQFRCVSKSWCSLISSPQFTKTHLDMSMNDSNYSHYNLILSSLAPCASVKNCSLYSLLYEPSANASETDLPLENPYDWFLIGDSCNGLFCITTEEDVFLWNPATRKSKKLPNLDLNSLSGYFLSYGFGFNERNDDYKVVAIFSVFHEEVDVVNVYSLRTGSWTRIEDFPGGCLWGFSGKFVHGALHWAAIVDLGSSRSWAIVSLDLATETYNEVAQPNYGEGKFDSKLGVLEGSLCVLCNNHASCAQIWVMKEYGVIESWTKLISIPYLTDPKGYQYSTPLCISKKGEVLLRFMSHLILYNPKDKTFSYPEIHNDGDFGGVVAYVESLVLPSVDARAES